MEIMDSLFTTSILKNSSSIKMLSRNVNLFSTSIHDPVRLCSTDFWKLIISHKSVTCISLLNASFCLHTCAHGCMYMPLRGCIIMHVCILIICTHSLTLLIFSYKDWKRKSSIWLMGIYRPAGNVQILDAVKHTAKQTTRKPKTSKKLPAYKNPEAFQQKIEYEKQIQKYLLNQWTWCTSN